MTRMDELCANCGLTFGSHRGDGSGLCPGHEGHMDWGQGPGSFFEATGMFHDVPPGTPAAGLTRAGRTSKREPLSPDGPTMTDPRAEFGLVMPFVCVTSVGGPFDDDSFVAGFRVGAIDAELRQAPHPMTFDFQVSEEELAQLDLVAMHRGFVMVHEDVGYGWVKATFTRMHESHDRKGTDS